MQRMFNFRCLSSQLSILYVFSHLSAEKCTFDPTLQQKLYEMARDELPGTVPAAAVIGDVKTLEGHLKKRPQDVCSSQYRSINSLIGVLISALSSPWSSGSFYTLSCPPPPKPR